MQAGANVESLQSYAWPENVALKIRRVATNRTTNATATIMEERQLSAQESDKLRVRILNSAESTNSSFRIGWENTDTTAESSQTLPVQVPPGQSVVIRLPRPDSGVTSLQLTGDDHDFDNRRFYAVPETRELTLLYIGNVPEDSRTSLAYYLQRAPLGNRYQTVKVVSQQSDRPLDQLDSTTTPLVVIESGLPVESASSLRNYLNDGGRVLAVLSNVASASEVVAVCNAITSEELSVTEADSNDYAMLSKIDFQNPIFEPMAEPPFNDFSKIRFWSHRSLSGLNERWSILASFDDGAPALVETSCGLGKLSILTAGWQPAASQLALSTKFVPLLTGLVGADRTLGSNDAVSVGDLIPFPPTDTAQITAPDGQRLPFREEGDASAIDQPGVYRWSDQERSNPFAVNLKLSESRIEPIGDDLLEQFGAKLATGSTQVADLQRQRQLRDRELEGRQRFWQWLLLAGLGLIGLETWLAHRSGRHYGNEPNEPSVT